MEITKTKIKDLLILKNPVFGDDRGFFTQWGTQQEVTEAIGREFKIAQFNHSQSQKDVLRGIHYENMDKLIYVATGKALCVFADLRPDSENFLQYEMVEIGPENRVAVFVPEGLGNSFLVLSDEPMNYMYLVGKVYKDTITRQVRWNDEDLNIPWPNMNPRISERDTTAQTVREAFPEKFK